MQIDFSIVSFLAAILAGFGLFVRLTIKSAIGDLKDDLAKVYMGKSEMEARLAAIRSECENRASAIYGRMDMLERLLADYNNNNSHAN